MLSAESRSDRALYDAASTANAGSGGDIEEPLSPLRNRDGSLKEPSAGGTADAICRSPKYLVPIVLLLALGIGIGVYVLVWSLNNTEGDLETRMCPIYCDSDILRQVQRGYLFNSSKTFVDLPMRADPAVIEARFEKLKLRLGVGDTDPTLPYSMPTVPINELRQFLAENFYPEAGINENELEVWLPPDFQDDPAFLSEVHDPTYRNWAREVHHVWKTLGKKMKADVYSNPQRHSLIPIPKPFIVPGGRFREIYYWDSYWVIKGLLVSGMRSTAKGMVENLLSLVRDFGFVPNGNRRYYLNRSQPPFLTQMVDLIYQDLLKNGPISSPKLDGSAGGPPNAQHTTVHLNPERPAVRARSAASSSEQVELPHEAPTVASGGDDAKSFLRAALRLLDNEYRWWMVEGRHAIKRTIGNTTYSVNRYYVNTTIPRPESYREDEDTAAKTKLDIGQAAMYSNLAAGAESGWDYSSRWFADNMNLSSIITRDVLPVDLNSLMCKNERTLARLHADLGDTQDAETYHKAYQRRKEMMYALFWDEGLSMWIDGKNRTDLGDADPGVISNFNPLWSGCFHDDIDGDRVAAALETSGLMLPGGLATTAVQFGFDKQQWDYPNAWAPLQEMVVEGLLALNTTRTNALAFSVADTWVKTNYLAYNHTEPHALWEKYDVRVLGKIGDGGEYPVQSGFGWTNGVLLSFLTQYGDRLVAPPLLSPAERRAAQAPPSAGKPSFAKKPKHHDDADDRHTNRRRLHSNGDGESRGAHPLTMHRVYKHVRSTQGVPPPTDDELHSARRTASHPMLQNNAHF